jgi:hypothetical protein
MLYEQGLCTCMYARLAIAVPYTSVGLVLVYQ